MRLIVTIYNRDLAAQVRRAVRNVRVMSMADIVAPALAGPCLVERLIAVSRSPSRAARRAACGRAPTGRRSRRCRRAAGGSATALRANAASLLHPFELSAKTLLAGLLGFVAILLTDAIVVGARAARAGDGGRVPRDARDRHRRPERGHRSRARVAACRSRR